MSFLRRLGCLAWYFLCGMAVFLAPAVAWADDDDKAPADQSNWTLAYLLVVLAIGLGLMVVCRPGTRQKEVKIIRDDADDEE